MRRHGMPVGANAYLSLNRSAPFISGMQKRHDDPREDTTITPADYIMESYAVRGPCERSFLNRGIQCSLVGSRRILGRIRY
jgi:hypothetical protein